MTICMVFDTETTGLPHVSVVENHNVHLWPHVVQLSYIMYNTETNEIVKQKNDIIKVPNNIIIPNNVVLIHGITNEISNNIGINIINPLLEFIEDYNKSDILIGHNIMFDVNMIRVELLRHVLYEEFNTLKKLKSYYCTMINTTKLCKLTKVNKRGVISPKWPKLIELHRHLFNTEPCHLHNAFNDILITLRCYVMIKFNDDICDKNPTIKNLIYKLLKTN